MEVKKIIIVLLGIFILGCSGKIENYKLEPCIKLFPKDAPLEWNIICAKSPFTNNTQIPKDVETALVKVGFLCPGFRYPYPEEVNSLCGN